MSTELYDDLVKDICSRFHIATPTDKELEEGFSLKVNQILFTLQHDAVFDEDGLLIFCEFSEYPTENVEAILRRLMQVNLFSYFRQGPKFSLNPDTGHVILFSRTSLAQVSSAILVLVLLNLSNCAHLWQKYSLLDDEIEKAASPHTIKSHLASRQNPNESFLTSKLFPDISIQFLDNDDVPMSDDSLNAVRKMTDDNANAEASAEIFNALFELEKKGLFQWAPVQEENSNNRV